MAEFADIVEETNVKPVKTATEKEIQDKNVEAEVEVEEGRKRKIGEEKDEGQSNENGIEDFLSDEAIEVMEKKILKKQFIGERGFKKFIPPFNELIEKRGWNFIYEHMPPERVALVREFYANLLDRKGTKCYVRGKWVSFHRHEINQLL